MQIKRFHVDVVSRNWVAAKGNILSTITSVDMLGMRFRLSTINKKMLVRGVSVSLIGDAIKQDLFFGLSVRGSIAAFGGLTFNYAELGEFKSGVIPVALDTDLAGTADIEFSRFFHGGSARKIQEVKSSAMAGRHNVFFDLSSFPFEIAPTAVEGLRVYVDSGDGSGIQDGSADSTMEVNIFGDLL